MRKLLHSLFIVFCLTVCLSDFAKGQGSTAPDASAVQAQKLVEAIEAVYSGGDTLRARFEIETVNETFGDVEIERGQFFASRPNQMKWEYSDPKGKILLLDGTYIWLYLPDEKQAFRGNQSEAASELTLALLADPGELQRRFFVGMAEDSSGEGGSGKLELLPREAGGEVQRVLLQVETSGVITAMELLDGFENTTVLRFSDHRFGEKIPKKTYELKLPRKTELLDFEGNPLP